MKLAIIIGVSKYEDDQIDDLKACKNDSSYIWDIVNRSSKYDDILFINEETSGDSIKNKIISFTEKYNDEEIDEVFYYFSGHGLYEKDEFYYICSDFSKDHKRTTSLVNSELDNYLRNLNANLVVKIVDACNSGVSYVKDLSGENFNKMLDLSKNAFNECYFMFSSQTSQSSYADENISFFTKSILECIIKNKNKSLRYNSLLDHVSDYFETDERQTPYFITQGTLTHYFFRDLSFIDEKQILFTTQEVPVVNKESKTLKDVIEFDSKHYLTKEDFDSLVKEMKAYMNEELELKTPIKNILDLESNSVSINEAKDVRLNKIVGEWLSKNPNIFFAKPLTSLETREVEVYPDDSHNFLKVAGLNSFQIKPSLLDSLYKSKKKTETIKKKIQIIDGYSFNDDTFDDAIFLLTATSKYPNIEDYLVQINYIYSNSKIKFFYSYGKTSTIDWDTKDLSFEDRKSFEVISFENRKRFHSVFNNIFTHFNDYIIKDLEKKLSHTINEIND